MNYCSSTITSFSWSFSIYKASLPHPVSIFLVSYLPTLCLPYCQPLRETMPTEDKRDGKRFKKSKRPPQIPSSLPELPDQICSKDVTDFCISLAVNTSVDDAYVQSLQSGLANLQQFESFTRNNQVNRGISEHPRTFIPK